MHVIDQAIARSTFFEGLDANHVKALARTGRIRRFESGERLIVEDAAAETFYVMISGSVRLTFEPPGQGVDESAKTGIAVRDYDDAGRFLGWSALIPPYVYRGTVSALSPIDAAEFDGAIVRAYLQRHPAFGVAVMKRVIWVIGTRLRETRIRLVAKRYDSEIAAFRALLDQSAPQLGVDSPLHKIPYYLEHRLTLSDAFDVLELLQAHGSRRERDLAALALDLLRNVRRELDLYKGLQRVYETVAGASPSASPEEVRERCCERFIEVFEKVRHLIKGVENLPDKPGFIVVMNHLRNHPENTLPNDFQLTLDTHFVSAMILFKKYGKPPIRVIRKSRHDEYGHQLYYDRLGYIYVYSGHVDESTADPDITHQDRRRFFLDTARDHLLAGTNVVICPEGTSVATADSPVAFKSGAFRLAAHVRPEPLIVPIAVANFDKKITRSKVSALILKPFRLSERIADATDDALHVFIADFNAEFRGYVKQAIALTD